MFAGIGGFRTGLTRAGGFQCVGHCEIDKYANASYCAIYEPGKEERYYPDARNIDPADLPRIFELGFTGENGRRDKRATGIGLGLSRRILQKLGHGISAESAPGVGTTVRIALDQAPLEVE